MRNANTPLTIAVTALNAIDSPGPGVAVIRALRHGLVAPLRIIGLSYETLEPGIYMHDLVDKTYQLPYPSAGVEALKARLAYIHKQENISVIIPNFDAELYSFIKIAPWLNELGISSFLPTFEQLEARDKVNLFSFGEKHDLLVPKDHIITRAEELHKTADDLGFPLVIKGKFYDAQVVHTIEQAQKAFVKQSAKWGLPIIAQQFISGNEINIAVLANGKGQAVSVIPMRKLYITDKGKAWAGITVDDDILHNLAQKFVGATNWRGGCELEIMLTADEKPYIMEVNPRFPAWIYLSVAAGQNQPATLVRLALGETIPPFSRYEVGKMFIRYAWDHITDVSEFQKISSLGEL